MSSYVILCHPMSSYVILLSSQLFASPKKSNGLCSTSFIFDLSTCFKNLFFARILIGNIWKTKRPFSEDSSPKSPKALKTGFSELSPILLLRLVLAALATLSRCCRLALRSELRSEVATGSRWAPGLPLRAFHGVLMKLWRLALRASRSKQRFLGWRDQNVGKYMKIPITISWKSDKIKWFSPQKLPKWYQITSNNHKIIKTLWRLIEEIAKCLRGCRDMFGPTWGRHPLSLELNMEPKLAIFNVFQLSSRPI